MKISIVIPNYNNGENLVKNLPQVLRSGADEVIIVDDASTDKSAEKIEGCFKNIRILRNEKNMGFSSAINRGVEEASGEIVVLLNTDVVPEADFLKPLLGHFSNSKVFAVGCMDKSLEDGKMVLRGRGVGKWSHGFLIHSRGEVDKTDTLWVSGGSGAFRKDLWEKFGGFDSLYDPFYWEDIDLSYRAQKAGYQILFDPKSQVFHKHEEGIIKLGFSSFYVKTIAYRNQFFFVWKNISDRDYFFQHLLWLPYHLFTRLINGDLAFIWGFLKALVRLSKVIRQRKITAGLWLKTDKEIIEKYVSA